MPAQARRGEQRVSRTSHEVRIALEIADYGRRWAALSIGSRGKYACGLFRLTGPDRYEAKGGGPMISMPPLFFAERMTRSKSTVRSVSAISFNAALAPR